MIKHKTKLSLQEKGWSAREIIRAEEIIAHATQKNLVLSKLLFWSALVLIIIANAAVTAVLVPFFILFPPKILYPLLVFIGLLMGLVYNFLLNDMAHIHTIHHIFAFILIPAIAIVNVIILNLTLIHFYPQLQSNYDPLVLGAIFASAFLIPYLISRIRMIFRIQKAEIQ